MKLPAAGKLLKTLVTTDELSRIDLEDATAVYTAIIHAKRATETRQAVGAAAAQGSAAQGGASGSGGGRGGRGGNGGGIGGVTGGGNGNGGDHERSPDTAAATAHDNGGLTDLSGKRKRVVPQRLAHSDPRPQPASAAPATTKKRPAADQGARGGGSGGGGGGVGGGGGGGEGRHGGGGGGNTGRAARRAAAGAAARSDRGSDDNLKLKIQALTQENNALKEAKAAATLEITAWKEAEGAATQELASLKVDMVGVLRHFYKPTGPGRKFSKRHRVGGI